MGDRLDIDALLIGALYGELDGDDRARLDAHLASHPADRAALDDLRTTRAWLTDHGARDFLGAAEPANAISQRLIQEAARRAPAPRAAAGGVFGFLAGLFRPIAAHPALSAAAAMLIVVGAGTLMMRRGSLEVAQPSAPAEHAAAATPTAPATPALPAAVAESGEAAVANADVPTDGYQVGLVDDQREAAKLSLAAKDTAELRKATGSSRGAAGAKPSAPGAASRGAGTATSFLELDKKQRGDDIALKKVDNADDDAAGGDELADKNAFRDIDRAGQSAQGAGSAATVAGTADAPPMAAPRPAAQALTDWARDQHARMVKLVNAGRCTEAGQIGSEIARRAPDYYQSAVANDRAVRSCQAYVDQARRAKQPAKAKNNVEPDVSPAADESK